MSEKEIKKELKKIREGLEKLNKALITLIYQFIGKESEDDDELISAMPKLNKELTKNPPNHFDDDILRYVG